MSEQTPPAGCLGFLAIFGIKIDMDKIMPVDRLEAELYPVGTVGRTHEFAEVEYTSFRSGERKMEIEVEDDAAIPPGEQAIILVHGVEICRLTIGPESDTEVKLRSDKGDEVPPIKPGDLAQLMYQGHIIAQGEFIAEYLDGKPVPRKR